MKEKNNPFDPNDYKRWYKRYVKDIRHKIKGEVPTVKGHALTAKKLREMHRILLKSSKVRTKEPPTAIVSNNFRNMHYEFVEFIDWVKEVNIKQASFTYELMFILKHIGKPFTAMDIHRICYLFSIFSGIDFKFYKQKTANRIFSNSISWYVSILEGAGYIMDSRETVCFITETLPFDNKTYRVTVDGAKYAKSAEHKRFLCNFCEIIANVDRYAIYMATETHYLLKRYNMKITRRRVKFIIKRKNSNLSRARINQIADVVMKFTKKNK